MSPRAAWRLESLGFTEVYDYVDGKLDWMAAGLPTEGTASNRPRAGDLARKDVLTCRLDERLGEVQQRARSGGWKAAVVVNDDDVVLGLLREKELGSDPERRVDEVMRPGPSTFRPFVSAEEMAHYMVEHDLENAPITTSDGRLVGLLVQEDAVRAAPHAACLRKSLRKRWWPAANASTRSTGVPFATTPNAPSPSATAASIRR